MTLSKAIQWLTFVTLAGSILASINVVTWEYFAKPVVKRVAVEAITDEKANKPGSYRTKYAEKEGISKDDVVDSNVTTARNVRLLMKLLGQYGTMLKDEKETKMIGLKLKEGKLHYTHTDGDVYKPQLVDTCDCYMFLNNRVKLERTK